MKITVSNSIVTNTTTSEIIFLQNASFIEPTVLDIGNSSLNSVAVNVGSSVSLNTTAMYAPLFVLGAGGVGGGQFGPVIDYQEFTSNGTWYNPYANSSANVNLSGDEEAFIMMWSAGSSGNTSVFANKGAAGGACQIASFPISLLSNTCTATLFPSSNYTYTTNGSSIFSITAYQNLVVPGATFETISANGAPASDFIDYRYAYEKGGVNGAYSSVKGGNGYGIFGGMPAIDRTVTGYSIYGAGSGGISFPGTSSVFGGWGGNSSVAPTIPGGGGSGGSSNTVNSIGARGEIRVWVIGSAKTSEY